MWFLPGRDFRRTIVIVHAFLIFGFVDTARSDGLRIRFISCSATHGELSGQCHNRDLSHAIRSFLRQTTGSHSAYASGSLFQDFAPSIPNFRIDRFYNLLNEIRESFCSGPCTASSVWLIV
ncbi:hypothetical protein Desti_0929 [Desulfomonile tiedjei DSM 6799]|uniref:Uncharacterized protein n=1 Tax=Desulfomonile tiedjei (strain ATCC 49306 / DSM 6799 / DCB-1) TaxID=706587 RepID=I4C257_DESTA|nr:hypothetical protein Desti_0929 [Desulfomonile tiedjei DSM 6799]